MFGYRSDLHAKSQLVKALMGQAEAVLNGPRFQPGELLVLNYHGTQRGFEDAFRWQMETLLKQLQPLAPAELPAFYENNQSEKGPYFLLTFDDGIRSNLHVLPILDDLGIKAYHFIIPEFVTAPDHKAYFLRHVRPHINTNLDKAPEDFEAFTYTELKELVNQGHALGSHTLSHTLRQTDALDEQTKQIVESRQALEAATGLTINSFCSPVNSLLSVSAEGAQLIKEHYDYHFTTLPGYNKQLKDPLFIQRVNVEAFWPKGQFLNAIGRWDKKRWKGKVQQYANLMQ